ncbi:cysteine hydrolase family protein [Salipaludibacillus sp. CF4.18]|uniref:cysteine hydrolase family protein n=1 Tax=Salipaludibacillus sp. CF4.18 TaxID=3373081 RepID=UPI003EE4B65E
MLNGKCALLIIDVQKAFEVKKWGVRNNPNAEENIEQILSVWRNLGWDIIHVQHKSNKVDSGFHPNHAGFQIKEIVKPIKDEVVIEKTVNSAFIGTDLENLLKEKQITQVVVTGLTTPHCVSTSTRMSGNLGFDTYLVSDATAAFGLKGHDGKYYRPEEVHDVSLVALNEEFATILTTNELIGKLKNG